MLGFIIPLPFCGNEDNADLRRLFQLGGRWTIKEMVDLEVVWRHVFDGDVLPLILIVEARPPRPEDKVAIRLADKSCLEFHDGEKRPAFRFDKLPELMIDYADLFSEDGRILTRLNPERLRILKKLRANDRFASALQAYWVKTERNQIVSWSRTRPAGNQRGWKEREMISRGLVFARRRRQDPRGRGHNLYKEEKILAGTRFGDPQDTNVDIASARNQYLFRYMNILPETMFAVGQIATCPNAVAFDPRTVAFTDTATIFGPRGDLVHFPFDLLLMSKIYSYYYVLTCRMSFLNNCGAHVYPTNLRLLPWNKRLREQSDHIEATREPIFAACADAFATQEAMMAEIERLPLRPLRDVVREKSGAKIEWSESFRSGLEKVHAASAKPRPGEQGWRIQMSEYLFDWIEISSDNIANLLHTALQAHQGADFDTASLLALPIPPDATIAGTFEAIVKRYRTADHQAALEAELDKLDVVVGTALGLDDENIARIRSDMRTDPFLRRVRPRYPRTATRIHGFRTGLDSARRYA
jgi:hypothetical protein